MKLICIILCALFFYQSALSQSSFDVKLDSLERELVQITDPLIKARTLAQMAALWESKNYAKSLVYSKEALVYAKKSGNEDAIMEISFGLGFAYMSVGDAPKSIEILQQLLQLTKNKDPENYGLALAFISLNYRQQGDYQKALNYAYQTEANYKQVIKTKGRLSDPRTYYGRLQNMAELFENMNRLDSAYFYGRQAYQAVQKPLPAGSEFFGWMNRLIYGKILQRLHQNNEAFKVLSEARLAAKRIDSNIGVQSVELVMATLFRQQNKIDSALVYATRVFEQAQASANYQTESEAGFLMRDIYQTQNNAPKALYYFEKAISAKDSITSAEKTRQVQMLTFEAERQKQEAQAQQTAYQNSVRQYALLAGLIMFLLIAVIIYRNYRQQKHLNTEIEALNEGLEQKVEQRTAELQNALNEVQTAFSKGQIVERKRVSADLHDEIGASLSTIAIFSDLTKRKAQQTAPELVNELEKIGKKSREMVQTMRDTIWSLNDESTQSVWERMYLMATEILTVKGIVLQWNVPPDESLPDLPFNTKRNLFLGFKEAINNIVKHAEATTVNVEWLMMNDELGYSIPNIEHQTSNTKFQIIILDNGKGFDIQSVKNQGNGLRNFEKRMAASGGTATIESKIGGGTKLIFSLPTNV
jgi:signal transduction histidine kinase